MPRNRKAIRRNRMERIYLDHTATTPLDDRVFEAMRPYFSGTFGNPSSIHSFGRDAKMALEKSREIIAEAIGAQSGELFFTSGGTESDNFAIRGLALAGRKRGKMHAVTSTAEHHAVLEPCEALHEEGFDVTILPVSRDGAIGAGQVRDALTHASCLVSVMHANNEVGTINPLKEIASSAHDFGVPVHTDAVQTLGKIPISVDELGVDAMTLSAHKLYGPKGIGALYIRRGTEIEPMLHGGGQERGKRPGTENVPLAIGFAKAIELALAEMNVEMKRLSSLRDTLEARITSEFPSAIINGHPTERLPHILNISFDSNKIKLEGEMLVMNMDLNGIAVSSGSACTSGSVQPSHVLLAMGRDMNTAKATLRFAFGKSNREEDVEFVAEALREVIRRMTLA
jgi:cysteine desulfurase